MTKEIDFGFLLKILKKSWWKMLLIILVFAIATALFTQFAIEKKYTQELEFFVLNASANDEFTTSALVSATTQLAKDYIKVINSDIHLAEVAKKVNDLDKGYNMTIAKLSGMITSKTYEDSSVFHIYVTSTNPELAFDVVETIKEVAPDIIKTNTTHSSLFVTQDKDGNDIEKEVPCVSVLSIPEYHESPSSPSLVKNVSLASAVALVGSYVVFFIIGFLDVTIRTKKDVRANIKAPLIGTIPSWEIDK